MVNGPLPLGRVVEYGKVGNPQRPCHLGQLNTAVVDEVPAAQGQITALGGVNQLQVGEVIEPMTPCYYDCPCLGDRNVGQQREVTSRGIHNIHQTPAQQMFDVSSGIHGKGELVQTRPQIDGEIVEAHHGNLVALSAKGIPQLESRSRRSRVQVEIVVDGQEDS